MRYPHLWTRLYNAPLLIHPEKVEVIERVFRAHVMGERNIRLDDDYEESPEQRAEREHQRRAAAYAGIPLQRRTDKPYALTNTGIAIIPILGTLVQRGGFMDAESGLTSYASIASLLETAVADPEVRAVLLEIDSPGGEGGGIVDLAARIYDGRKKKRMWSVAADQAYSAAYWLGSQSERFYAPITGGVGSIGVVALHVDQSRRDAQQGYTYTFVYAGERKIDMNSHRPLSEAGQARLELEVERFMGLFADAVAQGRNISAESARATQAALLTPDQAVAGKFIDGIATLKQTVALLEAVLGGGSTEILPGARLAGDDPSITLKETDMNEKELKHTDAQLNTAVEQARTSAKAEGVKEGTAAGNTAGVQAERERIRGILAHAEAKDRPQLALSLALESEMTVEQAAKVLTKAAKEAAGGGLATLMGNLKNPKVGVDVEPAGGAVAVIDPAAIYAARRLAAQSH